MQVDVHRAASKVNLLCARVDVLEKALNDLAMQLSLFISLQEQWLTRNRRWSEDTLGRIEAAEQRVQATARIEAMKGRMEDLWIRKQIIEVQVSKLLELSNRYSKIPLTKKAVSANVMATFVVPMYEELVRHSLDWKSPSFYTHHQGYKICLGVRGQEFHTNVLLVSLETLPGEYDESLNWPALYDFQVEIINKKGGENMSFRTGWNCWTRVHQGTESLLFQKGGIFAGKYFKIECKDLVDFVENNSVEITVAESPMTETVQQSNSKHKYHKLVADRKHPVGISKASCEVISNHKVLSESRLSKNCAIRNGQLPLNKKLNGLVTTMRLPHFSKFLKAREYSTETFHTHATGYKVMLGVRAYIVRGLNKDTFLLLTLHVIPGEYDGKLKWPAEFDFQLQIVNKLGGDNLTISTGLNRWNLPHKSSENLHFIKEGLHEYSVSINCDFLIGDFVANDSVEIRICATSKVKSYDKVADTGREAVGFRASMDQRIPAQVKSSRDATRFAHAQPSSATTGGSAAKAKDLGEVRTPDQASQHGNLFERSSEKYSGINRSANSQYRQSTVINIIKLNETVEGSSSNNVASFLLPNCTRFFNEELDLKSPPFYTHHCGYKLCLGLTAIRTCVTHRKVLLLSLCILPGEYNADLFWPAQYSFLLEIVNQHGVNSMAFKSNLVTWFAQEEGFEVLKCWEGLLQREYISVEYDKLLSFFYNDSLEVKIMVGNFGRSIERPVVHPESFEDTLLMHSYKDIVTRSLQWRSPVFYSHSQGYKLCLSVQGYTSGEGSKRLVLRLFRMCGEYDSLLVWPVWYDVHLRIINKRGGHNIIFSTGMMEWRRSYKDTMPLFFIQQLKHHVSVECSRLMDFVVDDTIEFSVQCERKRG